MSNEEKWVDRKNICVKQREDLYYRTGEIKLGGKDSDDHKVINNQ